jgi:Methyltransferase domain
MYPLSTIDVVDAYLADGFHEIRGMSSQFATAICAYLLARQTKLGITGHVAEIGTFEGRFLIAVALALAEGEKALGIDTFAWPDTGLLRRFQSHCVRWGVNDRTIAHKASSLELTPDRIEKTLGGQVRLWHLDGEHSRGMLKHDLDLAFATLAPDGLIAVDDMLHPEYPLLLIALHEWLQAHQDVRVLCILDREDIVSAAKFVLCRTAAIPRRAGADGGVQTIPLHSRLRVGGLLLHCAHATSADRRYRVMLLATLPTAKITTRSGRVVRIYVLRSKPLPAR